MRPERKALCCFLAYFVLSTCYLFLKYVNNNDKEEPKNLLHSFIATTSRRQLHQQQQQQQQRGGAIREGLAIKAVVRSRTTENDEGTNIKGMPLASDDVATTSHKPPPRLILHIGPAKTATTSVQFDLSGDLLKPWLRKDNYVYLGKINEKDGRTIRGLEGSTIHETLFNRSCLAELELKNNKNKHAPSDASSFVPSCWRGMMQEIEQRFQRHENLILSDEAFSFGQMVQRQRASKAFWRALQTAFRKYDVTIVTTYRHYHEWLLSSKEQAEKECLFGEGAIKKWPGQEGAKPCHIFWSTVRDYYVHPNKAHRYYYTDQLVDVWKKHDFSTVVLDYHDSSTNNSLTTALVCNVLMAPQACQQIRQESEETRYNPSVGYLTHYDSIVYAAAEHGLLKPRENRQKIVFNMHRHYSKHARRLNIANRSFPWLCPDRSDMEALLDKSLELANKVMPPMNETQYRDEFWQFVNNKAFCRVDTEAVLKGKSSWEEVMHFLFG